MAARHFLAWGLHSVHETLTRVPESALEIWIKDADASPDLRAVQILADRAGLVIQIVPTKTLDRLTSGAVHQGVVVRRRLPPGLSVEDYLSNLSSAAPYPLLLVLDRIQDPQNFGACLRVADGAGADAVLVPRDHSVPITGTVAKAASGALDSVPIIAVSNLSRALEQLRSAGMWLVGAAHDAPTTIYDCDFKLPVCVVVGSEAKGLRQLTRAKCDHLARIPMSGSVPSLNVSTATAITLFEANRQRATGR